MVSESTRQLRVAEDGSFKALGRAVKGAGDLTSSAWQRLEPYAEPRLSSARRVVNNRLGDLEPWQVAAIAAFTAVIVLQLLHLLSAYWETFQETGE